MFNELKYAFEVARFAHEEIYKSLQAARSVAQGVELEELVDIAYACREINKFVESLDKEVRGLDKFVERIGCLKWLQMVDGPDNIQTEYATATPDMRTCAKIPSVEADPAGYHKLMDYLGIDPVLRDAGDIETEHGKESTEVVRVHWPGFQTLVNRLNREGFQLPEGINPAANYTDYKFRIRGRKKINDAETREALQKGETPDNPF